MKEKCMSVVKRHIVNDHAVITSPKDALSVKETPCVEDAVVKDVYLKKFSNVAFLCAAKGGIGRFRV